MYMLIASDAAPQSGQTLNSGYPQVPAARPYVANADERRLSVLESLEGLSNTDADTVLVHPDGVYLIQVEPNGPTEYLHMDPDEYNDGVLCDDGWTITEVEGSPAAIAGPQYNEVLRLLQQLEGLTGEQKNGIIQASAVSDPATDAAAHAALSALRSIGVPDATWWMDTDEFGGEAVLALAARDLIREGEAWNQHAYDVLTTEYALVLGPLHPSDTVRRW